MTLGGPIWSVVGGGLQGGIIVRTGRGLNTPQRPTRLATGAVIEEQEIVEERLRFRKIEGAGPETGWVSIRLKDRDLLVRIKLAEVSNAKPEVPDTFRSNGTSLSKDGSPSQDLASTIDQAAEDRSTEQTQHTERITPVQEGAEANVAKNGIASSKIEKAYRDNRGNYWFNFDDMSSEATSEGGDSEPVPDLIDPAGKHDIQQESSCKPLDSSSLGTDTSVHVAMEEAEALDFEPSAKPVASLENSEDVSASCTVEQSAEVAETLRLAESIASNIEPLLNEPVICSDSQGMPRGRCKSCDKCKACVLAHRPYLCWIGGPPDREREEDKLSYKVGDKVEVRDKLGEEWMPGVVIVSQPSVLVRPDHWHSHHRGWPHIRRSQAEPVELPFLPERCQCCGCAAADHESLKEWHGKAEASLKRFRNTGRNTKRELPRCSRLPLAALDWSFDDVAVFVLTAGVYDPRRDGRGPSPEPSKTQVNVLVSVITPTSHKRHPFHPLLYEAFCSQTYEHKELVVVDTGDEPSAFLQERAREDPRIIYRWFHVKDARQQNLAECLIEAPAENNGKGGIGKGKGIPFQPWSKPGMFKMPPPKRPSHLNGKVRGGARVEGWTLGMKRNLACHLARGPIIAHFDDDDLYASCYLEIMATRLCQALGHDGTVARELLAGAATLQDWHVFDLADQTFGFVAPLTDNLLEYHMRQSYAYGFGFSYIYTRAAWELVMFADVEWSEDGHFTEELMQAGRPVKLIQCNSVKTTDALAAHSHHRDTTSAGEFVDYQINSDWGRRPVTRSIRMGEKVQPPKSLLSLVPLATEIAKSVGFRKGEIHPLRRQLSELPVGSEVGLEEKQKFMRSDVGKEIAQAAAIARRPQLANNFAQYRWRPPQAGGFPLSPMKGGGRGVGANPWGDRSAGWKGAGPGRGGNPWSGGKGGFVPFHRR